MQPNVKEVGGGAATGLSKDLIELLQSGLGGKFQARGNAAMGDTMGIAGFLNDILAGGAGNLGGSLADMIHKDTERQSADLRARFTAAGGTSFGTPAAYAESLFRADAAPRAALGIGDLQLRTLLPLLQLTGGLADRGISQRQTLATPSPFSQILGAAGGLASSFAPFLSNPFAGNGIPKAPDTSGFDPSALWNIPLYGTASN